MGYLSIYDITGIQNFIFNTNKLKEIVGGSALVEQTLRQYLVESIETVVQLERRITDWENQECFQLMKDEKILAEIIYIGGGNAVVAYRDEKIAKTVNMDFSQRIFKNTYSLGVAFTGISSDFKNFSEDIEKLGDKLDLFKNSMNRSTAGLNYSITIHDGDTGLPIIGKDSDGYYTKEKKLKRKVKISEQDYIKDKSTYIAPLEFDLMASEKGDNSFIGVVHIDGNNMGKTIEKTIKNINDYSQAVHAMREISKGVDKIFKDAFIHMSNTIEDKLSDDKFLTTNGIKLKEKENKKVYLIRQIILNGDDVTYVTNGKLALESAAIFIEFINKSTFPIANSPMSCCAGIALIGNHYPFKRGYELAEQCCSFAKQKAKAKSDSSTKEVKSYMDFQICTGHIGLLKKFREENYVFSGNLPKEEGIGERKYISYDLLERPWLIGEKGRFDLYNWEDFSKLYSFLTKEENNKKLWPRNRLKKLKSKFYIDKISIKDYLKECDSRGYKLLNVEVEYFNYKDIKPYFDVLDMMDYFALIEEVKK